MGGVNRWNTASWRTALGRLILSISCSNLQRLCYAYVAKEKKREMVKKKIYIYIIMK